jgi:hypothetical protein
MAGGIPTIDPGSLGGGGSMPTINTSGGASNTDSLSKGWDYLYKGIDSMNQNLYRNKQLAQQQAQSDRTFQQNANKQAFDQQMDIEKMSLQKEQFATLQQKERRQAEEDQRKAERDALKDTMMVTDWRNKQAAQQVIASNIGVMDKILNEGATGDAYNSLEFKNTLSALAIIDPGSATKFMSDAMKNKYEKGKETEKLASLKIISPIYTEEIPAAMDKLHNGGKISEVITPIKKRLDALYSTGQVSPDAYKDAMMEVLKLVESSKKKLDGDTEHYTSFDAQGKQTKDVDKAVRQVNAKTGKISTISQPKSEDPLDTLIKSALE